MGRFGVDNIVGVTTAPCDEIVGDTSRTLEVTVSSSTGKILMVVGRITSPSLSLSSSMHQQPEEESAETALRRFNVNGKYEQFGMELSSPPPYCSKLAIEGRSTQWNERFIPSLCIMVVVFFYHGCGLAKNEAAWCSFGCCWCQLCQAAVVVLQIR
jgi:hypothetical protein